MTYAHIVSNRIRIRRMWNDKITRRYVIGFWCTMFFLFEVKTGNSVGTKRGSERNDSECHLCNVNGTNGNHRTAKRRRSTNFHVLCVFVRIARESFSTHPKHLDIVCMNFRPRRKWKDKSEQNCQTKSLWWMLNVDTLTIQTDDH